MSDENALLAAIWEHPHEDTPRLMYADWLQENGQPERAEFIRVQCELARLDDWDEVKRPELVKREKKLWKKFEKVWRKGMPANLRDSTFRRGFLSPKQRELTVTQFCKLPTLAFAAAPLWDYCIEGYQAPISALAQSVNLLRVEKLKLSSYTTQKEVAEVLSSRFLRNVRALSLDMGRESVKGFSVLAANDAVENLTELDLEMGLDDADAAVLGDSPAFAKLRVLKAFHHDLTSKGVRSIFKSPHLSNLSELSLPPWYGDAGVRVIAKSRPVFRLRKLSIWGGTLTDETVAAVAEWPGLKTVRSLSISNGKVIGLRALANSPYAANLRELDLTLSGLGRAGALALARSKTLNLKQLVIRQTPASEDKTAEAALVKRFGKDVVKVRYQGERKRS